MKKKICVFIVGIFVLVFVISGTVICRYYIDSAKQNKTYENLVNVIENAEINNNTKDNIEPPKKEDYFTHYNQLYEQNSDIVGWIKIEDTKINYPVMQSVNKPNFYLKHGFDKGYTKYGCPYVQENCNVSMPSDNIVIYGHNMSDGSMFAALNDYKSKDFWKKHRTIMFDTLTQHNEYEIVSVFKTVVSPNSGKGFKYYHFIDAKNELEFNNYISECKKISFYDTGVSAKFGDKLITLSTCEYSQKNGRMVVVAKLIK